MPAVKPAPEDRPRLSPYIAVRDADAAIAFYTHVFGARETLRLATPDGPIAHAEIEIGDAVLMVSDEHPDFGAIAPPSLGGTPVGLHLYVTDVDAAVTTAQAAGATVLRAPKDEFYGDRTAMIADPFGHKWFLASRVEEVSHEETRRRWAEMFAGA